MKAPPNWQPNKFLKYFLLLQACKGPNYLLPAKNWLIREQYYLSNVFVGQLVNTSQSWFHYLCTLGSGTLAKSARVWHTVICLRGRREKREEGGEKSKETVGRGGRGIGDIKSTERGGRWAREAGDGEGEKSKERAPSMTLHSHAPCMLHRL